jgi:Polymorphic toxin system, DSP-PTPase phosphatase
MRRPESERTILIPPQTMPPIEGVAIPGDLYWVARRPAPLAGMRFPGPGFPWLAVKAAGFTCVVRLTSSGGVYDPSPLRMLLNSDLEDLYRRVEPTNPAGELQLIHSAAAAVSAALTQGEGVIVHCAGGRGRTGMVLGAVLVGLGIPSAEVTAYLDRVHVARGTSGWPESPWQAEALRQLEAERGARQ